MTVKERLWRNIQEVALLHEAPDHISVAGLRRVMATLLPEGPVFLEDIDALEWGVPEPGTPQE